MPTLIVILAVLSTALVTNTWINGSLFRPARDWLQGKIRQGPLLDRPRPWRARLLRTVAIGALCRYCVSHWIALVVTLALPDRPVPWWLMAAALTIAANVVISGYGLLSTINATLTTLDRYLQLQGYTLQQGPLVQPPADPAVVPPPSSSVPVQ